MLKCTCIPGAHGWTGGLFTSNLIQFCCQDLWEHNSSILRAAWCPGSLRSPFQFLFPSLYRGDQEAPYSQLQDEDHICLVLVDVMQLDDVGVQNLLQNSNLPFDLLTPHSTTAGPTLTFLNEFSSILHTGAFFSAFLHYSKLATARTRR